MQYRTVAFRGEMKKFFFFVFIITSFFYFVYTLL